MPPPPPPCSLELCRDQLKGVHMAMTGSMKRRRSTRESVGAWEEPGRSFNDAIAWITQQKRLIETAQWGDDSAAIEQQLISHQKFHSSIQRSPEVDRARDDLVGPARDKGNIHALDQEWDSLQQMSFGRTEQLRELQEIIQEISKEIMWVNDREEEELVFDWGDKNIDQYIPKKQEGYSNLMSALEDKEKDLNKLKAKVDALLKNNHPASDKIEAYKDTLQTQWSWLLQITKCIDTHLKENGAYSQFFKEANETYGILQKEHETVRRKFTCDKNTSLENLLELVQGLEREKEKIMDNKRQVQHLVNKSKSIVRLKPRNPEDKSSSQVIVKALCDFKQDQKVICKDNEAILNDNSQRSKWEVTGPGGLDMLVPSVCLIIPPPNPISVSLAHKNEQYYGAILSIWNQLYINARSLIAWQYCLLDIRSINSLNISMLAKMRPEEYRLMIKNLETHWEEFKRSYLGSQMFADEDKSNMEKQFTGAQARYDQLVVELPTYSQYYEKHCVTNAKSSGTGISRAAKKVQVSSSTSRSLSDLQALRLRLEAAEGSLSQHVHICLGDDGAHECGLRITQLEQRDIDSIREEYSRLREHILKELEGMKDSDKAQFLRSELGSTNERLGSLDSSYAAFLQRLQALMDMLESVARAEDIVKVNEARLTEKDTTSLSPSEVEDYISELKNIKAELDQKKEVVAAMEAQLANASHWNGQVVGTFHRCDLMLSKYTEQVGLLLDRWRRIQGQIDMRFQDLQLYLPQLQHYKQTSSSFDEWIDATRKKQDALQATKIDNVQTLKDNINNQKALNMEIKARRETLDSVLKDNEACVTSVKDYEAYLASYTSGLETLLNIPIKRTMLKSPSMDLNQEATHLQTRYMELFTLSGDYYKYLGELLKNMEELKMRNTRIDLLEEELRLLKEDMQDRNSKNKSLEDSVARYQLELSQSQNQLLSMEEVKQNTALQCNSTKESLETTQNQLADLNDQVGRLNYSLEEEKSKRRLAEERYTQQQEEYESVLRKRQKELETVSWSKVEVEKSVVTKDHEIEQLRQQLAEEAARIKELLKEISKLSYESHSQYSEIVKERDALLLKLQSSDKDKDRSLGLEEELNRIKLSLDSEVRNKQHLQDENERVKKDLSYWKDQYEGKQSLIRQYDTDKERMEREKSSLKSEIERLMRELRELEETYKNRLLAIQKELQDVTIVRKNMETELKSAREPPTLDGATLIFDGVRKPVTANQLLDCGVLDKLTFDQLVKGQKTVPGVSVDKKISLKGTGPIAGVVVESKMSLSEAKKQMLLSNGCADLLLEAQAATGHIIDPINNKKLTVEEACARGLVDIRDRDKLLAAEAAAMGYKDSSASKPLSVFEAMKKGIIDRNTGLRLLQAQESVGGILDPSLSVFLPKDTAIKHNLLDENLRNALNKSPACYLDPDTEQDVSYGALKKRCKTEPHTGLLLLPITEKLDSSKLIFDGVRKPVTAQQLLDCGVLDKPTFNQLIKGEKTVPEVSVDKKVFLKGTGSIAAVAAGPLGKMSLSEAKRQMLIFAPDSPDSLKHKASMSITLASPVEAVGEQEPVGAIFDTESLEKITIMEAVNRGLLDSITGLRLLEAQACTGGIINPTTGSRLGIQEASRQGIIDDDFATKLKPAQKAYFGFEDVKTRKKMSAAEALKEMWLPHEAGQRFLEYQFVTGGLYDPEVGCRRSIEDALKMDWLDVRSAQKLQDIRHHTKNLTCPKSKLKISYKEALDNCLVEESTGVRMLQASTVSSRGISSPYNVSSAPGSTTGSRSGSRRSSRRSSVDLGTPTSSSLTTRYCHTSFSNFSSH
uniref:Desmoplakin b n=1 Tax=Scophthalmus maximus TaxID=52904 RepID=A0A8D3DUE6_SCOMX